MSPVVCRRPLTRLGSRTRDVMTSVTELGVEAVALERTEGHALYRNAVRTLGVRRAETFNSLGRAVAGGGMTDYLVDAARSEMRTTASPPEPAT